MEDDWDRFVGKFEEKLSNAEHGFTQNFSSNFGCGLSNDNLNLSVPLEYEALVDRQTHPTRTHKMEWYNQRKAGLMKFVCDSCAHRDHTSCPGGTWCDCQHMARRKAK